jgi:hypothetical protein
MVAERREQILEHILEVRRIERAGGLRRAIAALPGRVSALGRRPEAAATLQRALEIRESATASPPRIAETRDLLSRARR